MAFGMFASFFLANLDTFLIYDLQEHQAIEVDSVEEVEEEEDVVVDGEHQEVGVVEGEVVVRLHIN